MPEGTDMADMTSPTPPIEAKTPIEVPEGIRMARAHLRADLPALLASRWTRRKFALYSKDGRVKIGRKYIDLVREANRLGLGDDECVIELIEPCAGSEDVEDITR
jgi:hypothetical protein